MATETYFQPGSLYWASVILGMLSTTIRGATRIVNSDPFDPKRTLKIIEKYRVRILMVSPTRLTSMLQVQNLKKFHLSKLNFIFTTGSLFGETLKQQVRKNLPNTTVLSFYGSTETTTSISMEVIHLGHPNAVGHVLPGNQVKIIEKEGNAVNNWKKGEILVKRDEMFHGYYNAPEKTKESMDDDGWLHTGDIGYFDGTGCLYIVDRIKDIILYKNFWVVPGALEDKISALEGVKEVVVVGIPNEIDVEWPAALVARTKDSKVTEEDVKRLVADNFAETKQLRGGVFFVDSLPQTHSGKYKRLEARKIAIELSKRYCKL